MTLIIIVGLIWAIASCLVDVALLVRATCPPPRRATPPAGPPSAASPS
jgi:hypothetical protein